MYTKEMVEYIAKSLVDNPEQVKVRVIEGDKSCIIELSVASEDMGKIIGRQGRIARAIRTIGKATALRDGKMVHIEIVEPE
jgi:predicted RNA-binding protein YlqC (UPF0109 family)